MGRLTDRGIPGDAREIGQYGTMLWTPRRTASTLVAESPQTANSPHLGFLCISGSVQVTSCMCSCFCLRGGQVHHGFNGSNQPCHLLPLISSSLAKKLGMRVKTQTLRDPRQRARCPPHRLPFSFSSLTTPHIFKPSGVVCSELQVCSLLLRLWGHCWRAEISCMTAESTPAGPKSIIVLMLQHLPGLAQGEGTPTKIFVL